jgi:hypothetical protein
MTFNISKYDRTIKDFWAELDSEMANVTISTRAQWLGNETTQILLERLFQPPKSETMDTARLQKQYQSWLKSPAPLIITAFAPFHNAIIGTNSYLLKQDITALLRGLSKRRGDVKIVTVGSDELRDQVKVILNDYQTQNIDLIKIRWLHSNLH